METMRNKYKAAGIWNIVCGVLYTLAYLGIFVLINLGIFAGTGGTADEEGRIVMSALITLIGAYLWDAFIIFPFFMILTGVEMLSNHKKGWGVIMLIVFNVLLKLLSCVIAAWTILFIPLAVIMFISICLDVRALFRKEKLLAARKKR